MLGNKKECYLFEHIYQLGLLHGQMKGYLQAQQDMLASFKKR